MGPECRRKVVADEDVCAMCTEIVLINRVRRRRKRSWKVEQTLREKASN